MTASFSTSVFPKKIGDSVGFLKIPVSSFLPFQIISVGSEILVERTNLPELDQDDYYWHQLVGLQVSNLSNQCLGEVDYLLETGSNDVLVVKPTANSIDDSERLVPYLYGQTVKGVDLDKQSILVDWDSDF